MKNNNEDLKHTDQEKQHEKANHTSQDFEETAREAEKEQKKKPGSQSNSSSQNNNGRGGGK